MVNEDAHHGGTQHPPERHRAACQSHQMRYRLRETSGTIDARFLRRTELPRVLGLRTNIIRFPVAC